MFARDRRFIVCSFVRSFVSSVRRASVRLSCVRAGGSPFVHCFRSVGPSVRPCKSRAFARCVDAGLRGSIVDKRSLHCLRSLVRSHRSSYDSVVRSNERRNECSIRFFSPSGRVGRWSLRCVPACIAMRAGHQRTNERTRRLSFVAGIQNWCVLKYERTNAFIAFASDNRPSLLPTPLFVLRDRRVRSRYVSVSRSTR